LQNWKNNNNSFQIVVVLLEEEKCFWFTSSVEVARVAFISLENIFTMPKEG